MTGECLRRTDHCVVTGCDLDDTPCALSASHAPCTFRADAASHCIDVRERRVVAVDERARDAAAQDRNRPCRLGGDELFRADFSG
jgi:hypothetical protein